MVAYSPSRRLWLFATFACPIVVPIPHGAHRMRQSAARQGLFSK
jgi:hypothetical protein